MSAPIVNRFALEYRRAHLGASQWAAAVGLDPYTEPLTLWERFVGLAPWDDEDNDATRMGRVLEDIIAQEAARRLDDVVVRCPTVEHPEHRWMCVTCDRSLLRRRCILECKATGIVSPSYEIREEWGSEGTDEIPARYVVQATAQTFLARANGATWLDECVVAALIGGRGICLFRVAYDEEFAILLAQRVAEFWSLVQRRVPPRGSPDAVSEFLSHSWRSHRRGDWRPAGQEEWLALAQLNMARATREKAIECETIAANALKAAIGPAEGLTFTGPDGRICARVPWRFRKDGVRVFGPIWLRDEKKSRATRQEDDDGGE